VTEIGLRVRAAAHVSRVTASSRQSGVNDAIGWALVVFLALVPIPFGSGRPLFWAINAAVVGLIGFAYAAVLSGMKEAYRYGLSRLPISTALFLAFGLYLAAQALPLAQLPGLAVIETWLSFPAPAGATIQPGTISVAPGATWLMLIRWATFGAFSFLVLQVAGSERRRDFLLNSALIVVAFYAVFGLASLVQLGDTILGLQKWAYEGSATATFVNRNSFATFLGFGAVVCCASLAGAFVRQLPAPGERATRRRLDLMMFVYAVGLLAIVAALLATQSRMGAFATFVGCLLVVAAAILRMPRPWLGALLLLPAVVAAGGLALYVYGQGMLERLGSASASSDVRLDLYRQVVDMIAARPWLGFGGGSFELAYPVFHQLPVSPDLLWEKAHNSYLSLWAEMGLIAGSIPILLYVLAFVHVLRGFGAARRSWTARAAGLGAMTVGGFHSLVDFSLEIQADTIMLLFITAIAVAAAFRDGEIETARQ